MTKFLRWLAAKFAGAAAIVVLALAIGGLWLYVKDNVDFDEWRRDAVRTLTGERAKYQAALGDVGHRLETLSAEIAANREKLRQADKIIAGLKELDSTWDRYVGNREQQKINDARLAKVTADREAIVAEIEKRQQEFARTTWERDGLEVALGKLDVQLRAVEAKRSKAWHYFEQVWNYPVGRGVLRLPVKGWILLVLGLYFVGPTFGKVSLYFLVAPWIARGRPVRLTPNAAVMPEVAESRVAVELRLGHDERLWIKEKFLQASDEGLRRKTRYMLDWRIPLTCVATGLTELIEMANTSTGAGDQRLTLSNQADPHSELSIVTLADGASLVLRPSFLAGVVTREGKRLEIRRRWQLFRWQSWVTLQLRFFEFAGPCRLIVAGSRGVRVENLADREGPGLPARRTNQDATIGFTPNLDYRPVRAETFWSYYRGMNPLFDDLFAGRGIFLCQQVATDGDAKKARKFWAGVWSGVMKIFGL